MAIEIRIDGYDSFEQIALGGMAAVYKARRISIDKIVAIKVLFPYLAADESFIDRFQREAKSAAKVQHENIVNVVDFGESGGCYYIVMEFYEGVTIADLLNDQRRIPLDISVAILLDVCLGLEAAHEQDIIHRDVKPANVIYTNAGGIKIADFGLAKKSDTMTIVTQPGKVLGTPAYMSPEQAAGEAVGPQSDIFSLGVVAFEMFCHKRPFEGGSYSEVIEKIQTYDIPPLSNENPLIRPEFENIVRKMLEKEPSKRYPGIVEVISDIERAMENFDIKRDRRRLQKYIKDPAAYERAFNDKMVAKCLSQGTYFMQKGKTHMTEAIQEFKRILYLDPTNERARKHLAKIVSEQSDGQSTVTIDAAERPPHGKVKKKTEPAQSTVDGQRDRQRGRSRSWLVFVATLIVAGGVAYGGWQGWNWMGTSRADKGAPILSSPSRLTVTEGETVEFNVSVLDSDGDSVRVYSKNLPDGAALTSSGEFTWAVGYEQSGAHEIEFLADDGTQVSRTQTQIEVVDRPSSVDFTTPKNQRTAVGKGVNVRLQASSSLGNPVEFALRDAPDGVELRGDRVMWTPRSNQTGKHEVVVRGSDGVAEAMETVVIEVSPPAKPKRARVVKKGHVDWVLPKPANIYVDDKLQVSGDTYLSIELPEGRHTVRAELVGGIAAFEEVVNVRGGKRHTIEPPRITYGSLSVYFLGGIGEFHLNGKKFEEQPPFTAVALPAGRYAASCAMFRDEDSRAFYIEVKEGENTVVEYEIGSEPVVNYEDE